VQDNSMSREDKLTKIHTLRETTIAKVRQTLNPDQQPKFDQMIENVHQREGGAAPGSATPSAGTPPASSAPPAPTPPSSGRPPQ
ncbi:MAG TPA: hypothetical protein VI685_07120, partial [Candidatus Angelobacter sp.]